MKVLGLVLYFEVDAIEEPKDSTLEENMFSSIFVAQSCTNYKVVGDLSLNIKPKCPS